jgi:hypothetical protein
LFRLSTRVYLGDEKPGKNDRCVAAVIAKNPGSAKPGSAPGETLDCPAPVLFEAGMMLRYVRNRFLEAYKLARINPTGAYVRVWNLFYLCNPKLREAINSYSQVKEPLRCPTEKSKWPPIVWYAWGPPRTGKFKCLTQMKERFRGRKVEYAFYYDMDSKKVEETIPKLESRAQYPLGMPGDPIERHVAELLQKLERRT